NKATMSVASPCRGQVAELLVEIQQSYPVGATLGFLEVEAGEIARLGLDTTSEVAAAASGSFETSESTKRGDLESSTSTRVQPTVRGLPVPAHATGASYISPRMRARMSELGLHAADLAGVAGSGAAGRLTVEDFEKFIALIDQHKLTPASSMRV